MGLSLPDLKHEKPLLAQSKNHMPLDTLKPLLIVETIEKLNQKIQGRIPGKIELWPSVAYV